MLTLAALLDRTGHSVFNWLCIHIDTSLHFPLTQHFSILICNHSNFIFSFNINDHHHNSLNQPAFDHHNSSEEYNNFNFGEYNNSEDHNYRLYRLRWDMKTEVWFIELWSDLESIVYWSSLSGDGCQFSDMASMFHQTEETNSPVLSWGWRFLTSPSVVENSLPWPHYRWMPDGHISAIRVTYQHQISSSSRADIFQMSWFIKGMTF